MCFWSFDSIRHILGIKKKILELLYPLVRRCLDFIIFSLTLTTVTRFAHVVTKKKLRLVSLGCIQCIFSQFRGTKLYL